MNRPRKAKRLYRKSTFTFNTAFDKNRLDPLFPYLFKIIAWSILLLLVLSLMLP